jgi:hypothetical protein
MGTNIFKVVPLGTAPPPPIFYRAKQ